MVSNEQILQQTRNDLKTLAKMCLLAFKEANITMSSNPVIAKAVKECELLVSVKTKQFAGW